MIPLLFLALSLFPSEQADARTVHFSANLTALELIAEVNDLRAAENLPAYQTNSVLMIVAQTHADYLASTGVLSHFDAKGQSPFQRVIKAGYSVAGDLSKGGLFLENVGSGSGLTALDIIRIWQEDTEDMQTMISTELEDVGAGLAVVDGVTYFVLDAGASTNDSVPPTLSVTGTPLSGTQPAVVSISTPLEDGTVYHLVQANEGLWSIALNYNTTIENLKSLNGLATDEIFEGQRLLVRKPEVKTATPTFVATATFGIPTSTATHPVTPTTTSTATPLPVAPASRQNGTMAVGFIILAALIAAGVGSWLSGEKST